MFLLAIGQVSVYKNMVEILRDSVVESYQRETDGKLCTRVIRFPIVTMTKRNMRLIFDLQQVVDQLESGRKQRIYESQDFSLEPYYEPHSAREQEFRLRLHGEDLFETDLMRGQVGP